VFGTLSVRLALAGILLGTACQAGPDPAPAGPAVTTAPGPPIEAQDDVVKLARRRIEHVVYVIKENRTFDHMFGRFPGADGATTGLTCDGREVPLERASDVPGPNHSFQGAGAINGGRMNCFDRLDGGEQLQSYVQFRPDQIPAYWAYAGNYVLADRFFSSTYGPTGIEHLFTVGATTDGFTDHQRATPLGQFGTNGIPREYCMDRTESMWSFRLDMTPAEVEGRVRAGRGGGGAPLRTRYWFMREACTDIGSCPTCWKRRASRGATTSATTTASTLALIEARSSDRWPTRWSPTTTSSRTWRTATCPRSHG
jgi:hypothetical protein